MSASSKFKKQKWSTQENVWVLQEDGILKSSIQELYKGTLPPSSEISWTRLTSYLPGRTTLQIRERYTYILDPYVNRKRVTPEETLLVLKYTRFYGHKWSLIATHLPGRTSLLVKNAYYSAQRRFKRYHGQQPESSTELVNFFETVVLGRASSRGTSPDHINFGWSSMSGLAAPSSQENSILAQTLPLLAESSQESTNDQHTASSATMTSTSMDFRVIKPCLPELDLSKYQEKRSSNEEANEHGPPGYFIETVKTENDESQSDRCLSQLAMDLGTQYIANRGDVWDNELLSNPSPSFERVAYDPSRDQLDTRSVSSDDTDMLCMNCTFIDEE